jgi:hypothetical protein
MQWLERLVELRSRPADVTSWNDRMFEAHELFAHETFLYIVAALLKSGAFQALAEVYRTHYLLPETEQQGEVVFDTFDIFHSHARRIASLVTPAGQQLLSPTAAVFKGNATKPDIPFVSIIDADLMTFLAAMLGKDTRWYPDTLFYLGYLRARPFFLRATQHKHFRKLALITGIENADELRKKALEGYDRIGVKEWSTFGMYVHGSIWNALNLDKLDTIL